AGRRRSPTTPGGVWNRLRQPERLGGRAFYVSLLGERRHAADSAREDPYRRVRRAGASPHHPLGLRRLPNLPLGLGRRRARRRALRTRPCPRVDRRARSRQTPPAAPRVRLPGDEEHGERRAHPPEHAFLLGLDPDPRPLGGTNPQIYRSFSSIVGSASRSLATLRMKASRSSSAGTTWSCFFRRARARFRRAAAP